MSPTFSSQANPDVSAELCVESHDGEQSSFHLSGGNTVIVGSMSQCGLRLDGDAITGMHCVFRLMDGKLWVQDWSPGNGTLVNGDEITGETEVPFGGEIRVGTYRIVARKAGSKARHDHGSSTRPSPPPTNGDAGIYIDEKQSPAVGVSDDSVSPEASAAMESSAGNATAQHVDAESSSNVHLTTVEPQPQVAPPLASFEQETIDLLQKEVELLQSELADRDARLAELSSLVNHHEPSTVDDPSENSISTERLEELLDELERGDQRVRSLEELLQLTEDANAAEQEERRQLQKWVSDIEDRIGQREAEFVAENEVLRRRIGEILQERNELDVKLSQAASDGNANDVGQETLNELRQQVDSLRDRLDRSERENESLRKELDEAVSHSSRDIEEELKQERLQLAQERAAISRQTAELSKKLAEMQQSGASGRSREADERFHAFRQHLKEIHQDERSTRPRAASLSERIVDLWKRLDGPTDRD